MEIDQNNLHMKFSALNVDFRSQSPNPVGSRRIAQAGIKEGYHSKKWLFIRFWPVCSTEIVADRHRHAAYHNKHW